MLHCMHLTFTIVVANGVSIVKDKSKIKLFNKGKVVGNLKYVA